MDGQRHVCVLKEPLHWCVAEWCEAFRNQHSMIYLHSSGAPYIIFKYEVLMVYCIVQWLYEQVRKLKEKITQINLHIVSTKDLQCIWNSPLCHNTISYLITISGTVPCMHAWWINPEFGLVCFLLRRTVSIIFLSIWADRRDCKSFCLSTYIQAQQKRC